MSDGPPSDIASKPAASDLPSVKRVRRRELLAARRGLTTADVAAASRRVVEHLLGLPELVGTSTILVYAADPDEIDLGVLLDGGPRGHRVLLPRVEGDRLVTVAHAPGDALRIGALGVREPAGPALEPSDAGIDAVVVPGVAFTTTGGRLGRGRGLYDRLLPQLQDAVRIGVCAEQFVLDDLPLEDHDVRMDLVISDASVRRRGAVDRDPSA